MNVWTIVLALSALLLSGCTSGADPASTIAPTAAASTAVDAETGIIRGVVVDDSDLPVAHAEVAEVHSALIVTTNEAGAFEIGPLPPGEAKIAAAKPGYISSGVKTTVVAGETIEVRIVLTQIAFDLEDPYHVTQTKTTYIDCGLYVIRPVNCNINEDRSVAKWNFGDLTGSPGAWFETAWKPSGDLMKAAAVTWIYTPAEKDRAGLFTAQGKGPLRKALPAETLKRTDMPGMNCGPEGCQMESRHGPPATAVNTAQPEWIGLSYQQRIDDWVTVFYHGTLPEEFTALPKD